MNLWDQIRTDFKEGVSQLRRGIPLLWRTALSETEVLRLRLQLAAIEGKIEESYKEIGGRAYQALSTPGGEEKHGSLDGEGIRHLITQVHVLLNEKQALLLRIEDLQRFPHE